MKTITTQSEIADDGTLRLEVPTGLTPGPAEVVIVVQPAPAGVESHAKSLSGKYARFSRVDIDAIAEVRAIRHRAGQPGQEMPE